MKKFCLKSLEKTFDKINDIQDKIINDEQSIIKIGYKKCNNKSIESILFVLYWCFEEDYKLASDKYYDSINFFSDAYLEGSEWYIGREYTREYFFSQIDDDTKYKFIFMNLFLSSIYKT